MYKEPFQVLLPKEHLEALRSLSANSKVSISEYIRQAIDCWLTRQIKLVDKPNRSAKA